MPSPWVKKIAKETDKSEREVEKLWKKAKEITSEEFGKDEDDFGNKEYAYTTGVVKKMLGVDESLLDPSKFLESEHSAKDYIETVVSGNFSIGNVKPPQEDEDDEITYDEEEEYEEEEEEYDEEEYDEEEYDEEDEENAYYESASRFTMEELDKLERESLKGAAPLNNEKESKEIDKDDLVEDSDTSENHSNDDEVDPNYINRLDSLIQDEV